MSVLTFHTTPPPTLNIRTCSFQNVGWESLSLLRTTERPCNRPPLVRAIAWERSKLHLKQQDEFTNLQFSSSMAYHEMRLLFALFLWHFDLELVAKHENWIDQLVFTLWQKPPLMVIIRPAAQG